MISSICSDKKQPERRRHPSQRSGVISVNISAFAQDYKSPRKCCEEEEKRELYRRPCFLCSGSLQTVLCINESGTWASRHKNVLICRVHHQHLYNACHVSAVPSEVQVCFNICKGDTVGCIHKDSWEARVCFIKETLARDIFQPCLFASIIKFLSREVCGDQKESSPDVSLTRTKWVLCLNIT